MASSSSSKPKKVESLQHEGAKRRIIPTAELQSTAEHIEKQDPFEPVVYKRNS